MAKFSLSDLLNDQSKPKAEHAAEICKVPLSSLRPSTLNKYRIADIEDLAANIEMVGLLHNLVVTAPGPDGMHDIISGERRYWACKSLFENGNKEYAQVNCRIEPQGDGDAVTELKLLFANATARDLSDYEKTYQAARIKELLLQMRKDGHKFTGRMRDIVAEMLGVSSAQMGRMESISKNLAPEFQEEFKAGTIGISAAYDISTMPDNEQKAAHNKYKATGEVPVKPNAKSPKAGTAPANNPGVSIAEALHHPERVPQSGPRPDPPAPTPPPDPPQGAKQAGLIVKYNVIKVEDGTLVENCFVLRPDKDPAAISALREYARVTPNKALAEDIYRWVGDKDV